ncbi:glycosyltransferase family 4 protein [Candidatus Woesearchaeota archaeon]|nr:glycosyltransferase family 4 protein [Candidatus Woesearchaeota archaeon]
MKRLCILAPEFIPTWGGVGTYCVNLVKELSNNYEVHVITPKRGKNYNSLKIEKELNIKIHNITYANDSFFYNFKFQLGLLFKFWSLNKKYNFNIIHSANLVHMPDIWLKFFSSYRKIPHLVTIHTLIETQLEATNLSKSKRSFCELMSLIFYPYIKFLQKIYIKKSKNFVTVSHFYAKKIKELYNINVNVIYNGVDKNIFYKVNKKEASEKFNLKSNKKKILYVGRLLAQKGIFDLINAVKDLDVELIIVGHGAKIDNIKCLGYIDNNDLKYIYSSVDLLVLPSYYENFPMSIIEALSCECKVIASNVGGIPEILDRKYMFKPGNISEIKKKINETLDSSYNFKEFSAKKMAEEMKTIYENLNY